VIVNKSFGISVPAGMRNGCKAVSEKSAFRRKRELTPAVFRQRSRLGVRDGNNLERQEVFSQLEATLACALA